MKKGLLILMSLMMIGCGNNLLEEQNSEKLKTFDKISTESEYIYNKDAEYLILEITNKKVTNVTLNIVYKSEGEAENAESLLTNIDQYEKIEREVNILIVTFKDSYVKIYKDASLKTIDKDLIKEGYHKIGE